MAAAAAVAAFIATLAFLDWKVELATQHSIVVIDGDTVRHQGFTYRLVGFETLERGDTARCD